MAIDTRDSILALKVIRDVVGESGINALYAEKNNSEIYIPLRCNETHWMSVMFGLDTANEICRRLTVENADGRKVVGISVYITNGRNRLQSFKQQLRREVTESLLAGKTVSETARDVGVCIRMVTREMKSLCDTKRLERPVRRRLLPAPKPALPMPPKLPMNPGHWEVKAALVDEALLGALSTGRISVAVGVSRGYVRIRRKMLEAAGKLKTAPRHDAPVSDRKPRDVTRSPDHFANIGEMVGTSSDEARP